MARGNISNSQINEYGISLDMKAFDSLPKHLRDVHNYIPLDLSPVVTLDYSNRGYVDTQSVLFAMGEEMVNNELIRFPSTKLFEKTTLEGIEDAKRPTRKQRRR